MSECKNCGKEIPREANVCCENCGEPVDQVLEDALKSMDKDYKGENHTHSPLKYFSQGQVIVKLPGGPETEIIQTKPHYFLWFIFTLKQWWERRKEKKKLKKLKKALADPKTSMSLIHVPERNRIDLPTFEPITEAKFTDTFDPSVTYNTIDPTRTTILPAGEMKTYLLEHPIFDVVETPSIDYLYHEVVERIINEYPCCMKPDYKGDVMDSGMDGMFMKKYMITCKTCRKHIAFTHNNFL